MQKNTELKTVEKIQSIVKEDCIITSVYRFGETSSESDVYLLTCTDKAEQKIVKVAKGDTSYKSEIEIMADKYMQDNRLCPKLFQHTDDVIVMEFIPSTLARWLAVLALDIVNKQYRIVHKEFSNVTASLVDKLYKFHRKYSHGDLHSNNILIKHVKQDNTHECFIIDFSNDLKDRHGRIVSTVRPPDMSDKKFALENLSGSFKIYSLQICAESLGSTQSGEYKTCENIISLFNTMFIAAVKDVYKIQLSQ